MLNKKLNCGTAILTESLKQLEDIELHRDGLLYGIPISIKDSVDYKVLRGDNNKLPFLMWTGPVGRFSGSGFVIPYNG